MIRRAIVALSAIVVMGVGLFIVSSATGQSTTQSGANQARAFALGVPYTNFNWKTVHVQDRGCNACHEDHLVEDINRTTVGQEKPELHGILATSYGIPMRLEDCQACHVKLKTGCCGAKYFADSVHSLHMNALSFVRMGGSCNSCHATSRDGKFVLYNDQTRYDIINGVKNSPTPAFTR
jgi:hypothetical protein